MGLKLTLCRGRLPSASCHLASPSCGLLSVCPQGSCVPFYSHNSATRPYGCPSASQFITVIASVWFCWLAQPLGLPVAVTVGSPGVLNRVAPHLCVCVGGGALGYLSLWRCISSVPWQSWWPRSLRADPLVCVHHMLGALLCCVYGVLPVQLPVSDPGCPWLLLVTAVRPSPCSSALGTGLEVVKFCSDACHLLSGLTCLCTQAGSTGLSQGGVPSPAASQNSRESRNSSFPGLESLSHGSWSA